MRGLAQDVGASTEEGDWKMGCGFVARCYAVFVIEKLGFKKEVASGAKDEA